MDIIQIEGDVRYKITLDPSVWIFDDRKVDLSDFFYKQTDETTKTDSDVNPISGQWDREIMAGEATPPTIKSEKTFKKEQLKDGTFGISFFPFLKNAEPLEGASKLVIHTSTKETHVVSLPEAKEAILGFSKDGKPLKEDGPVYFYYGNGSNKENPIKHIIKFSIK